MSLREQAIEIWNAGVDAVRAAPLVEREVHVDGDELSIGGDRWSRADFDRVLVVGAGKAGTGMAQGLLASLGPWLPISGWINVPEGTERDLGTIHVHPARPAGVNEPTEAGVEGTGQILKQVSNAGQRDLCIVLISGGGSALLPSPISSITLDDKLQVTRFLSGAGANIVELNTVRKRLSRVKGGGLLRACRAAELVTIVLSDVLGDPLDMIASGPTVPDTTTAAEALAVLQKYDPRRTLPKRVYDALQTEEPSPAPMMTHFTTAVIGSNAVAVDEAGIRAEQLGFNHAMHSATEVEGSAEEVGVRLAEMTIEMLGQRDRDEHSINCLITGGEPTVTLAPKERRGLGGRNQQLVLAAYQHLLSKSLEPQQWSRLCLLSGGTDGEDGPTDAAGAFLDEQVHHRAQQLGLDIADHLDRNDAYRFFEAAGGLLMTGPTGTNVCDVRVAVVN